MAADLLVGADTSIPAAVAHRSRKAERVGCRGIDPHSVSAFPHLDGIDAGIGAEIGFRGFGKAGGVAAEERGAFVEFHPLGIVVETAE